MSNNSRAEILVVDDDAISRQVLAKLLTATGYKCHVCKDGSEALEAVHAKPAFLPGLGFGLPGLNRAYGLKRPRKDRQWVGAQNSPLLFAGPGKVRMVETVLQARAD